MNRTVSIMVSRNRAKQEFGRFPKPGHLACPAFQVDLSMLAGLARHLAEHVGTTWNGDDASRVKVYGQKTQREVESELWDTGAWYPQMGKKFATVDAYHEHIGKVFGVDLDSKASFNYHWGPMLDNETPADFFNRVAEQILEQGVSAVEVGINCKRWENPAASKQ